MKIEGSNVFVTGAGGFIGSHLCEALVRIGAQVKAFVHYNSRNDWGLIEVLPDKIRSNLDVIAGDIRDAFLVASAMKDCEIVFHLASLIAIPFSYRAPWSYVNTNLNGTINVMQAALEQKVHKIVHTSTSEVYGTAKYTPIDEDHPLQGQSPYAASKIGADKIAESFHLSFGLPVATIRPFNTFGPRQSARAVIPTIICQALTQDEIKLGLLTPVRDLTYIQNTVEGFLKIAESSESVGRVINIGSGQGISIGALAQKIIKILSIEKQIVTSKERLRPKESEVMNLICNNTRARKLLGWKPRILLDDGIQETIEDCRNNLQRYKSQIYNT
jgi:NAD dependent epimerase/dehydratase